MIIIISTNLNGIDIMELYVYQPFQKLILFRHESHDKYHHNDFRMPGAYHGLARSGCIR